MNTPTPPGRRVAKPKSKQVAEQSAAPTPISPVAETPVVPAPKPEPTPQPEPSVKPEEAKAEHPRNKRPDKHHRKPHNRPRQKPTEFDPAPEAAPAPAHHAAPEASPAEQTPGQQEMGPQTRGLTLLGAKTTVYSDRYTSAILEAFENRHPENDYFVKFNCPEFTSLCPITGQPDFATITINYIPDRKMVESKSLKLYLFGFRNHGAFHEDCVNLIMKDLIKLLSPRYIEVWGKFLPRGGLSIDPYANYGRPTTRWEEFARQRLLMHDLAPEKIDNR